MPAVTSFVIPNLLGNGKVNLIGNIIEQQFLLTYDWGFGAALSLVLMIMILISMAVMQRSDEDMEGGADYGKKRYRKALFGIDYAFPVCTDTDVDSVFFQRLKIKSQMGRLYFEMV